EVELSIINEPREFQADNIDETLKPLAPSIQKRTTLAIRNRKCNITKTRLTRSFQELNRDNGDITLPNKTITRSALEKLFEEKQTDWKRCDFVKACIEQNIHLDDNAELNKKKLFTWFDGKTGIKVLIADVKLILYVYE
ncbi:28034_t:CDS:2, partial [Racocetra persica]